MSLTQAPPLNVAHEMLSDLKSNWRKRNSFQEPFHSFICNVGAEKRKGSGYETHRHCETDGNC